MDTYEEGSKTCGCAVLMHIFSHCNGTMGISPCSGLSLCACARACVCACVCVCIQSLPDVLAAFWFNKIAVTV